jgi:hypothetical protein
VNFADAAHAMRYTDAVRESLQAPCNLRAVIDAAGRRIMREYVRAVLAEIDPEELCALQFLAGHPWAEPLPEWMKPKFPRKGVARDVR